MQYPVYEWTVSMRGLFPDMSYCNLSEIRRDGKILMGVSSESQTSATQSDSGKFA